MGGLSNRDGEIFEDLFVLEMANNHWGQVPRGLKIIRDFGAVVRHNNVRAAIKLQFRNVESFIHPDYVGNQELRYVAKTEATRLTKEQVTALVSEIRKVGCMPMSTPFDEQSVRLCEELDLPIIKVASSDVNDWPLLEAIAATQRPVIVSSGGASEKSLDDVVHFFEHRDIPLAINHCVSLYPSEDSELELNQIDYLKARYPGHVIGFSTHEYSSWDASMLMSYAKGARTWERHIDIDLDDVPVSPYCTLPHQADAWFKAFHLAKLMSGASQVTRRTLPEREIKYLDALVRGIYARRNLQKGHVIQRGSFERDFYLAIPLHRGQLSVREVMEGTRLIRDVAANSALMVGDTDGPYSLDPTLSSTIKERGI